MHQNLLGSIVVVCFLASIIFPLLMCSLILAEATIDESTESWSLKEKIYICMKFILLSFLNPMILIDKYKTNKEKLGQILLLLLTITKTSTTGGLEKIFEKTSIFYLVIFIGWSVKTFFMEHLKLKTLDKSFMLFTSKMLLLLCV